MDTNALLDLDQRSAARHVPERLAAAPRRRALEARLTVQVALQEPGMDRPRSSPAMREILRIFR